MRRLAAAWRHLAAEQRVVAITAGVLLLTMLLPWYSLDAFTDGKQATASKMAITVFSFVEAAIFLVALAVTLLVLARGDRRAFHLPGGDGTIVTIAGGWVTFLVFYRFVDKPNAPSAGKTAVVYSLSWGIFFGLLAAIALLVAGLRLRAAQLAEPALPGSVSPSDAPVPPAPAPPRARAAATPAPAPGTAETRVVADPAAQTRAARRAEREQRRRASAETPVRESRPPRVEPPPEAATTRLPADEAPTRVERRGDASSFEPPEFELPPRRPRGQS